MKILIADDDLLFRTLVSEVLTDAGYEVSPHENGALAWESLQTEGADMAVLDVNMLEMDGVELLNHIRADERFRGMPVLMLTIRSMVDDQVESYNHGADDYLTKPFAFSVLAAKINAVLRRYGAGLGPAARKIREQGLELDPAARTIKLDGKLVSLTRKEFDLLTLMLEKKGRILGIPYMLETVWGYDMATYDNPHTVETHVSSLRKKLGSKLAARLVKVTGHGYKFE